ncbi:GNAT family N-acetyltransferase [Nisaea sp.]|uniref:GNAT family N-acetyltransferase n=1 Tax=Nisaea sp. TaxID=2024842 RepID=UPI003267E159
MSQNLNTNAQGPRESAAAESRLTLDCYQATARRIESADRHLLHELTLGVFWPHRDHDLDLFLALGEGYLAIDEIGRAMGSAMYFNMGGDFAMLGMMVTAPRLQTQGAGRWLLNSIMTDCEGRDLRLSATHAGYSLYESAGFIPVNRIWQHQGIARDIHSPTPAQGIETRALMPEDVPALLAIDQPAFGADRSEVLKVLLELSEGCIALRNGEIVGYALMRPFGRGKVIGPVVAEADRIAMQMIAPLVQANVGSFMRLDTPLQSEPFTGFLAAAGMGVYETVTEMRIGPHRRSSEGIQLFGLAAHSIG